MVKYDYDFKKSVVQAYQRGEVGYATLARRYGIPADLNVNKWVKIVDKLGFSSNRCQQQNRTFLC
ncbi:transposase [Enterococcus plantarum]|uniref:transposase n=1 Tax=Enterococcus plantarum TaxID=1077675 RepID=UPI001A8FBEC1|nr:transposase [Enterococcus plantarum]MBO0468518.1 transposase [Enterococcus plantarum]